MAARSAESRSEWVVLAAVVTAAAVAVPPQAAAWAYGSLSWLGAVWLDRNLGRDNFDAVFGVGFGLVLVLTNPARAGVVLPDLRRGPWRTLAACAAVLAGTFALDRRLDLPLLRGDGPGYPTWLLGPVAADLVYAGFLFGKFDQLWPRPIARWVPVRPAVVLSAAFYAGSFAAAFQTTDPAAVREQMLVAMVGGVALGLARQWTGSVLPVALTHVAAGWMVWHGLGLPR